MKQKYSIILPPKKRLIANSSIGKNLSHLKSKIYSAKSILVLSPHLDDAILSMGSLLTYLALNNKPVTIATICTQGSTVTTPAIKIISMRASITNIGAYFKLRKREDRNAIQTISTHFRIHHLDMVDAAWRQRKSKAIYPNTQLAKISAEDRPFIYDVSTVLQRKFPLKKYDLIFAPLGRGRHVDHQITRNLASEQYPHVVYYADFPYSSHYDNEDDFIHKHSLQWTEWHGGYTKKRAAILKYVSQLPALFVWGRMKLPHERFYFSRY